jgi:hypothetical protein
MVTMHVSRTLELSMNRVAAIKQRPPLPRPSPPVEEGEDPRIPYMGSKSERHFRRNLSPSDGDRENGGNSGAELPRCPTVAILFASPATGTNTRPMSALDIASICRGHVENLIRSGRQSPKFRHQASERVLPRRRRCRLWRGDRR